MTDDSGSKRSLMAVSLIVVGILMIIVSWTPIGRVASRGMWTNEDAATYSKIRQQIHSSTYQSAAQSGITETELKAQKERLNVKAEAMRKKLDRAKGQPERWSRYLFWVGILLAAAGSFAHSTGRS